MATVSKNVFQIAQGTVATGTNLLNGSARSNNNAGTAKSLGGNQAKMDDRVLGSPEKPIHVGYRLSGFGWQGDALQGPKYPRGGQVSRSIPLFVGTSTTIRPIHNEDVLVSLIDSRISQGGTTTVIAVRNDIPIASSRFAEYNIHGHYARGVIKGLGRTNYTRLSTYSGPVPTKHPMGFSSVPLGSNTIQKSLHRQITNRKQYRWLEYTQLSSPDYNTYLHVWAKDTSITQLNASSHITNNHYNERTNLLFDPYPTDHYTLTDTMPRDQQAISRAVPGEITIRTGSKIPFNADYSAKNT